MIIDKTGIEKHDLKEIELELKEIELELYKTKKGIAMNWKGNWN